MLNFRNKPVPSDVKDVEQMLKATGFFDAAPDEIQVAVEQIEKTLSLGSDAVDYRFFFAMEKGKVVGYVCYVKTACTQTTYEIYWLCVSPDCQHLGIGKQLVQQVLDAMAAEGGRKLVVQTAGRAQYAPTQRFYLSCGFIEEARIKDYYGPGDDTLYYTMDCIDRKVSAHSQQ